MLWTLGLVVTGVVLFDFSADFVEGPIRAYVMDVCDKDDVKRGLYYQAIFTGKPILSPLCLLSNYVPCTPSGIISALITPAKP